MLNQSCSNGIWCSNQVVINHHLINRLTFVHGLVFVLFYVQLYYNWNPDLLEIPLVSSHLFTNARNLARLFTLLENSVDKLTNATVSDTAQFVFKKSIRNWMLQVVNTSSYDPVLHRYLKLSSAGFMVTNSPKVLFI